MEGIGDQDLQLYRGLPTILASFANLKELELEAFSPAVVDLLWIASTINALPLLLKLHVMEEDLISELPDEVLCSILSLLPMKDKVKTSILSTRWRYQWASTPYLDFDIYTMNERIINLMSPSVGKLELAIQDEKGLQVVNSEFVRYVSKILQLYRCPKIHSFMVSYLFDQLASCHLDQWIEFAIAKGVESLELNLIYPPSFFIIKEYLVLKRNLLYPPCLPCNIKGSDKWMLTPSFTIDKLFYTFPCFLLSPGGQKTTSSTLKHLHLRLCILDVPAGPSFNGFRTLVSLDLQDVKLMNAESLFSSCLLLEVLSMRKSKLPHTLEAVGPFVKNLKCLEVYGCFGVRNILVSAMKLTTFGYENAIGFGPGLFNLSLHNVPKLTRLHINIIGESTHIIPSVLTQLRKDLPHFESLFISSTIEIITQPALMLASFVNLKELELRAFIDPKSRNLLWIVSAIDVLPFLLKLHVMIYCGRSSGEERKMKTSGPPHNHLKEVLITGFNPDISYQVELLIYLLKNAVALEQMTIDPKRRYYCTDFRKKELVSSIYSPAWDERQTNKFYEALHKEVPGSASLVTVCNH